MSAGFDSSTALVDGVTPPALRARYEADGLWDDATLVGLVTRRAELSPERVAVVDELDGPRHTYQELLDDARSVAAALHDRGVRPGSVVSVQMPNWYETVVADLAVLMNGAVLNPLLPIYREREIRNALVAARVRHVITPSQYRNVDYRALVARAAEGIPGVQHVVLDRHDRTLMSGRAPAAAAALSTAADVSELIFSSGTEAEPKAIMHTEQTANAGVRMAARAIGLRDGDGVWMPSPIGHSTGLNFGVRMALVHGQTLTLQDVWDADTAVDLVLRMHPAYTVAATTFLSDFVDAASRRGADVSCLRLFSCGGAPVPSRLVERAAGLDIGVLRLYGSTEVLIGSWNRPDSPWEKRVSTDGVPFDDVELEVRDGSGTGLVGEPGELFVRSPSTAVGFFGDAVRTKATFVGDGWVRTGDVGVLDADGYFTMVSRKKEILIRGGLNVAPREVEDLLLSMPGVREAAIVGLPDDRLGEIGCACLVLQPGTVVTLPDLVAYLRSRGLAPFKLPERLLVLDELPRTPTGKIQKFELVSALTTNQTPATEDVSRS